MLTLGRTSHPTAVMVPAHAAPALHDGTSRVVFYDDPRVSHIEPAPYPRRFLLEFDQLVARSAAQSAVVLGCGDGYLSRRLAGRACDVSALDSAMETVRAARQVAERKGVAARYATANLTDLPEDLSGDLLVCVDLLQRLDNPGAALASYSALGFRFGLFAVPGGLRRRLAQLIGGAAATSGAAGDQHRWSPRGFGDLVAEHFMVVDLRRASGWTLVLARFPNRALLSRARATSVPGVQNVRPPDAAPDQDLH